MVLSFFLPYMFCAVATECYCAVGASNDITESECQRYQGSASNTTMIPEPMYVRGSNASEWYALWNIDV